MLNSGLFTLPAAAGNRIAKQLIRNEVVYDIVGHRRTRHRYWFQPGGWLFLVHCFLARMYVGFDGRASGPLVGRGLAGESARLDKAAAV